MTREEIAAAVELARKVDDFDPENAARICDEDNEPPVCIACGDEYRMMEYDHDPTPLDDGCAHEAVTQFARAIIALHAEVERMRPVWDAAVELQAWQGSDDTATVSVAAEALWTAIDTARQGAAT